jgi:hypothetical protein
VTRPTRADAAGRAYLDVQNLARRQGRSTQALLVVYALEGFLARRWRLASAIRHWIGNLHT